MKFYQEIFYDLSKFVSAKTGVFSLISGALGGTASMLLSGKITAYTWLCLILAIALDWTGGSAAAKKDGSYASEYGLQGIVRTAVLLAIPFFGYCLDKVIGTPNILFFVFWGGLLYHTVISMTANFTRAGWDRWIPNKAIQYVSSEIEAKAKRSGSRLLERVTDAIDSELNKKEK